MATSTTLARGSLRGAAHQAPAPALTFAQHRAAITQLLVVDAECVLSVDRDRVAMLWNPRTAECIERYDLPANAIVGSACAPRRGGYAYVVVDGDALTVHALDDHRTELARIAVTGQITHALCTADLSRVLISYGDRLFLLSLADGKQLADGDVSSQSWSPEVLAIHEQPDGRAFVVRYFHIGMDMYPGDGEKHFDVGTLDQLRNVQDHVDRLAPPFPIAPTTSVWISGTQATVRIEGRPLPALAHEHPISVSAWLPADLALLTADQGGTIHRWEVDLEPQQILPQHKDAVTTVRFAPHGAVSCSTAETKLWRDDTLIASLPAFKKLIIDEDTQYLVDGSPRLISRYSLADGRSFDSIGYPRTTTLGPEPHPSTRGRIALSMTTGHPALGIAATSATKKLRAEFRVKEIVTHDPVAVLVDDEREEVWLLHAGVLLRAPLLRDGPIETIATIPGATELTWIAPAMVVVQEDSGSFSVLRSSGELVCKVEGFAPSSWSPAAFAESAIACAMPDHIRVAAIPGDSFTTLRDPRATIAASALAIAPPFLASRHGNQVLRWDLRTSTCDGAWTAPTTLAAIDVREDGAVLAGEANGTVTVLR